MNVLAVLVLGVLLGWLIEWLYIRFMRIDPAETLKSELESYRKSTPPLREKVRALQENDKALTAENEALKAKIKALESEQAKAGLVEAELNEPYVKDDLTRIKGIGPKLAQALGSAGITDYQKLADLDLDQLIEILAPSNIRFSKDAAQSWLVQAELAEKSD
ncbi:MAG: helix-hairpin-helix domain-containing protein [Thiotrichales bacterium]